MAKKTHLKVRMVPESNPDSKFIYYAKKPTKGCLLYTSPSPRD